MIEKTLEHLTDDGIMVVQFGELDFEDGAEPDEPLRRHRAGGAGAASASTTRVATCSWRPSRRRTRRPVDDHGQAHAVHRRRRSSASSTACPTVPDQVPIYAPGPHLRRPRRGRAPWSRAGLGERRGGRRDRRRAPDRDISAITDDAPFFWHFSSFGDVLGNIIDPIERDRPRGRHRRAGAPAAPRRRRGLRRGVPARCRSSPCGAQWAALPVEGHLGRLLRLPRASASCSSRSR